MLKKVPHSLTEERNISFPGHLLNTSTEVVPYKGNTRTSQPSPLPSLIGLSQSPKLYFSTVIGNAVLFQDYKQMNYRIWLFMYQQERVKCMEVILKQLDQQSRAEYQPLSMIILSWWHSPMSQLVMISRPGLHSSRMSLSSLSMALSQQSNDARILCH